MFSLAVDIWAELLRAFQESAGVRIFPSHVLNRPSFDLRTSEFRFADVEF